MPIANSEIYRFLKPGLDRSFFQMYDAYEPLPNEATLPDVASVITSDTYENEYAAIGNVPGLSRFKGELTLDGIKDKMSYTIENHEYANGIEIATRDIKNEKYGQILMRAGQLGNKARKSIDKFVFEAIHNGAANLAYDKKALFADDHVVGDSGTIDNNLATALDETNLVAAIVKMQKFKDDRGDPANVTPNLLLVAPALFPTAWKLINGTQNIVTKPITADSTGAMTPNLNTVGAYGLTVKFSSWFTSDTEWYLLNTRDAVKPVICQEGEPVQTKFSDVDEFKKELVYYKGTWYGETGYYDFRNILRGNA